MKHYIFIAVICALAVFSMTSCTNNIKLPTKEQRENLKAMHEYRDSEKWGKVVEQDKGSEAFNTLTTHGNVEIVYTQDSVYSVKVYGNEKAIENYLFSYNTNQEGSVDLNIYCQGAEFNRLHNGAISKDTPAITVYVTSPQLEGITTYGAGDIQIKNDLKQDANLNIYMVGAGDLNISSIQVDQLNVTIDGAGDLDIKKAICQGNADITINGAGDLDAKIKSANTRLEIDGAGDAKIDVNCNELHALCKGVGNIKLKGECNKLYKNDNLMGSVDSRNLKVNDKIEDNK